MTRPGGPCTVAGMRDGQPAPNGTYQIQIQTQTQTQIQMMQLNVSGRWSTEQSRTDAQSSPRTLK